MVVAMLNSIGEKFCSISSSSGLRVGNAWVSASRRNKTSLNSWCWRKMSRVVSNRSNIVRNSSSVTGFPAAAGAAVLGGSVAEGSFHIDRLQYRLRLMFVAAARLFLGRGDFKLL